MEIVQIAQNPPNSQRGHRRNVIRVALRQIKRNFAGPVRRSDPDLIRQPVQPIAAVADRDRAPPGPARMKRDDHAAKDGRSIHYQTGRLAFAELTWQKGRDLGELEAVRSIHRYREPVEYQAIRAAAPDSCAVNVENRTHCTKLSVKTWLRLIASWIPRATSARVCIMANWICSATECPTARPMS